MTESQEQEFDVLGCKVKCQPGHNDSQNAKDVIDLVLREVSELKSKRPMLRDTDVAVLVALKMATEKMQAEDDFKQSILELETSLEMALRGKILEEN